MKKQQSHAPHQGDTINSLVNYLRELTKNVGEELSFEVLVSIANSTLATPYDLVNVITSHVPNIDQLALSESLEILSRPRPLQIPLKTSDKKDNHVSYFSFAAAPNVDNVESYYASTRDNTLQQVRTSKYEKFLNQFLPDSLKNKVHLNEGLLWQPTFEHDHLDLHAGVRRLLGDQTHSSENHSAKIPQTLLKHVSPPQQIRNKEPYALWLTLANPEHLVPYQDRYNFTKTHELLAKLNINSINSYSIESGVNIITLGIEYCSISVVETSSSDMLAFVEEFPITAEDVREINYQLGHVNQKTFAEKLSFIELQILNSLPHDTSDLHPKKVESIKRKRTTYLSSLGIDTEVVNTSHWLAIAKSKGKYFTLTSLLDSLHPEGMFGTTDEEKRAILKRPLIYSQFQVEARKELQSKPELKRYLDRVISHIAAVLNQNYIASSHTRTESFGDIDVHTTVSRQGGCTVINNLYRDRQHNNQFISNIGKKVYLGAMITAYTQYIFLNGIDQQYGFSLAQLNNPGALEKHGKLKNYLIHFRVNYTFTDISKLDLHNQAFEAWRSVFRLQELTEQLDQDVNDTSALIDTIYHQQEMSHNKSLRHIATIGTAIIFLTGLFGMNFDEFNDNVPNLISWNWHLGVIGAVIVVFLIFSESQKIFRWLNVQCDKVRERFLKQDKK